MNKKILVVSNEPFSNTGANSRTIKNLLLCVPKQNLAQFYIHGTPDQEFCSHYYQVSDGDVLRAFLGRPKAERTVSRPVNEMPQVPQMHQPPQRKIVKSYKTLVFRNWVWQSMRWWTKEFEKFLDDFGPQVVLLQAGDAPFMYAIARKIAKRYQAKLLMFNTENYVLKKKMYASKKKNFPWHFLLMSSLKRQYRKFMAKADYCTYGTEYLEDCYQKKYPHSNKSAFFYVGTEMQDCSQVAEERKEFSLVYCGNLGVGRVPVLCAIAQVLHDIDESAKLIVYGKFTNEMEHQRLCGYENVIHGGFVSYEQIPSILAQASMVLHCENNSRSEDLIAAFSTKIADCLACGKPFLVVATKQYPFVAYLDKHHVAHIAQTKEELTQILKACMVDREYRNQYIENAKQLAHKNHNSQRNSEMFAEILD